ncbi:MAG: gamma-glutamylcyclotransferase [Hyphomicrobiales bacterium]|nr:gamma-glutamylcyclotransferase [Hyphomicrobiales bacterium]
MSDCWVFGYGSLMWRPGFKFQDVVPARLEGAHRSLCVYSVNHRGTRRFPGLVFGLDISGSCDGLAFQVPEDLWQATAAYLRAREQVTRVYNHAMKPIVLLNGGGKTVKALTYLVNRRHQQYAGCLPISLQADIVRRARGKSGRNMDYVLNTILHLRELGIRDVGLERLTLALGSRHLFSARRSLKSEDKDR